eukprot:2281197-Rhodomonas_salina.4
MGKKPLNEEGTELEALTGATTSPREADQSSPRLGRELSGKFPSAPSLLSAVKWPHTCCAAMPGEHCFASEYRTQLPVLTNDMVLPGDAGLYFDAVGIMPPDC